MERVEAVHPRVNGGKKEENPGRWQGDGWKEDERAVWLNLKSPGLVRRDVYMEIKSADDPESLQTAGPDFIWITESQDIKEAAWNKLRPMLNSSGRLGRGCIEGIPPFARNHWFSKLFKWSQENPTEDYEAFHATSSTTFFFQKNKSRQYEMKSPPCRNPYGNACTSRNNPTAVEGSSDRAR